MHYVLSLHNPTLPLSPSCTHSPPHPQSPHDVSSGYSSGAEFLPVDEGEETMNTEDYELYDPRVHAFKRQQQQIRNRQRNKPKQEVRDFVACAAV